MNHKRICKLYNKMISLVEFRRLAPHERMDVFLLSHFLARIPRTGSEPLDGDINDPLSLFLSLLPAPKTAPEILAILPNSLTPQEDLAMSIYSRFNNNNFTIHSHMNTIGHGVFPLASRLFNHSCAPNAAPRYIFTSPQSVIMEVVALRDITPGEEVCVPYLDPALTQSRHQAFQYTYGFTCECHSCILIRKFGQIPRPDSLDVTSSVSEALRSYVGVDHMVGANLPEPSLADLPASLRCVLHESYMEHLSEQFSKASHEGNYSIAVPSGFTLLALYLLVYPHNYPQIGLHLLELAKTNWNALVSSESSGETEAKVQARITLKHAQRILSIYGREGDEHGPLDEIQQLEKLLGE
ncbi:hypothetical protein P691DRAFT_710399 [Macrolepiota fuliginosa MF-IS2]|uniref:SET domain-containing protein n=1 Tax=Macrolepiota fuliginosa MF-IS2 TaxID=1400762 RepID=A0A9P5X8N7_9AGAR|nr:hypothetical protein P691DRAFT_710399 [Macrolepiota fuliginosa MF-IS2]